MQTRCKCGDWEGRCPVRERYRLTIPHGNATIVENYAPGGSTVTAICYAHRRCEVHSSTVVRGERRGDHNRVRGHIRYCQLGRAIRTWCKISVALVAVQNR